MSELPKSINTTFELGIKVLTPLHVGGGKEKEWVQGVDFFQQENSNQVVKVNQYKLAKLIKDPDDLVDIFINASNTKLSSLVRKHLAAVEEQFEFQFKSTREIKSNIRTGLHYKPYIPGSSLKGAIASILGKHLGFTDKNKNVLGSPTNGTALMRFVKISDAHFEKTELVQTKIFNLFENSKGGWKHWKGTNQYLGNNYEDVNSSFASTYETVATKQIAKLQLHLATEALFNFLRYSDENISDNKQQIIQSNQQALFKIINEHIKSYIQKEIDFLEKYANKETPKIIQTFKWLLNLIPGDNSFCILKMAAGCGFHSITGDWQFTNNYDLEAWGQPKYTDRKFNRNYDKDFDKYGISSRNQEKLEGKKKFKSRKIAIKQLKGKLEFYPMGFVLLAPIEKIESVALSQEELAAQQEKFLQEKERKEQLAKEQAEKAARELAAKEKEQTRLLMEKEAIKIYDTILQNPTIERYQDFLAKFPESQLAIKANQSILDLRQQAKLDAAKEATNIDLEFSNYKFGTVKKLLNDLLKQHTKKGFSFSDKQQKQIIDAVQNSWVLENQNIKKSAFMKKGKTLPFNKYPWTDISKWLGIEKARQLYNKLNQS